MARPKGSWEGSTVTAEDIQYLRDTRRLPPATEVAVRLPGGELAPQAEGTERVVFFSHFKRGFGLPASDFFRSFLDFFGLQPHHLGANAVLLLSGFVTLCEGYLGVEPSVDLWVRFFFLKQQGPEAGVMSACGAAVISARPHGACPKMPLEDSAKKWQNSFFYVRNLGADRINLPPFADVTPHAKTNWSYCPKDPAQEVLNQCSRVVVMTSREGLTGTDLIAAFVARRVLPLQRRTHIIAQMTGLQDPNRMSSRRLTQEQVADRVNDISKAGMKQEWRFGKTPYSQGNPAPVVSPWSPYFAMCHLFLRPDATREVLLAAIWHPYDGTSTQVVRAGSEEAETLAEDPEAADAEAGEERRTGKFFAF